MTFSVLSKVSLDSKTSSAEKDVHTVEYKDRNMAREPSVRPKDLKNTVNHSFTFYKLGSPYNAIHGNLKCNFNKHF